MTTMERDHQMLLSIIMPTYNSTDSLTRIKKNIQPVINHPQVEVLLVDDGSSDGTANRLHQLFFDAVNVKIWQLKQVRGPSFCRTLALKKAAGKYVYFMDSDDKVLRGFYQKIVPALKTYDADIFFFDYVTFMHRVRLWTKNCWLSKAAALKSILRLHHWHSSAGFLWNKVFKRSTIVHLKFKNILFEDLDWCIRSVLKAHRLRYIKACGYHYIYHFNSLFNSSLRKRSAKLICDRLTVQHELNKIVADKSLRIRNTTIAPLLAKYNLLVVFKMLLLAQLSHSYSRVKYQLFACYQQLNIKPRKLWEVILTHSINRLINKSETT